MENIGFLSPTLVSGTVDALISCNDLNYRWERAFYAIKDVIIRRYGIFVGLDRQWWYDEDHTYCEMTGEDEHSQCDAYAIHVHILMRYLVGSVFFHIPTDEFYYHNYNMRVTKQSNHFDEMIPFCADWKNGKKQYCLDSQKQSAAFKSLKWLIRTYGSMLIKEQRKLQ